MANESCCSMAKERNAGRADARAAPARAFTGSCTLVSQDEVNANGRREGTGSAGLLGEDDYREHGAHQTRVELHGLVEWRSVLRRDLHLAYRASAENFGRIFARISVGVGPVLSMLHSLGMCLREGARPL